MQRAGKMAMAKNGKQYLESVIKGELKNDSRPKSILDMF
jgi:hypothetical protein